MSRRCKSANNVSTRAYIYLRDGGTEILARTTTRPDRSPHAPRPTRPRPTPQIAGKFAQRATDIASLEGLKLSIWWKKLKYKLEFPKSDYDPFTGVLDSNTTYDNSPVYYLSGVQINHNVFSSNTYLHFRAKLFTNNSRVFLNYAQYEGKAKSKTYSEEQFEAGATHVFYSQIQLG